MSPFVLWYDMRVGGMWFMYQVEPKRATHRSCFVLNLRTSPLLPLPALQEADILFRRKPPYNADLADEGEGYVVSWSPNFQLSLF